MVREMAEKLRADGYSDVRADDIGWNSCPDPIAGRIPDVTALTSVGHPIIVEVETAESINTAETRSQWRAFSMYARRERGVFWVLVPAETGRAAEFAATSAGIPVDEFWRHTSAQAA
jgi:hypothetical protein